MQLKVTSLTKLYLLLLLAEGEQCGYALMKKVGCKIGKNVSPGEVYPFLRVLERGGFVVGGKRGARDKCAYRLTTPKGRKLVKNLLETFSEFVEVAVKQRVHKCAFCSCLIYGGGFRAKVGGKTRLFCCENCAKAFRK
jgi:DNA-binding PadR family transcriptional regulator